MNQNKFGVDSKVRITSDRHIKFYNCSTGIVKSLNKLGNQAIAGIELESGRFCWIPEHCLE